MNTLIDHIQLIDDCNINPIPIEFGNEMTATKTLYAIQAKVNKIIDLGNSWEANANTYTDEQCATIENEFKGLMELVNNGQIVKDGSINIKKMDLSFLDDLQNIIIKFVHDASKFVSFSIDKNGYFVADMPDTWNDITFSTDDEGRLNLDIIT